MGLLKEALISGWESLGGPVLHLSMGVEVNEKGDLYSQDEKF